MIAIMTEVIRLPEIMLRGGSWNNENPQNFRAAYRNRNEPQNRNNNRGFRFMFSSIPFSSLRGRLPASQNNAWLRLGVCGKG
jgi:hypothetical protein